MTETPIGTIVYAIDDESVDVDPFDKAKTIQLQDVVTHGIPNDKSFINHNLFTIGDGNDAIVERDSDEDDDDDGVGVDDVFDIDGVADKHTPVHSKFANFAFNNEKVIARPKIDNNKKPSNPSQIELQQQQQQQSNLTEQNTEHGSHQGQAKATNTFVAPPSTNRQMNYKHSSKYIKHSIPIISSKSKRVQKTLGENHIKKCKYARSHSLSHTLTHRMSIN